MKVGRDKVRGGGGGEGGREGRANIRSSNSQ